MGKAEKCKPYNTKEKNHIKRDSNLDHRCDRGSPYMLHQLWMMKVACFVSIISFWLAVKPESETTNHHMIRNTFCKQLDWNNFISNVGRSTTSAVDPFPSLTAALKSNDLNFCKKLVHVYYA